MNVVTQKLNPEAIRADFPVLNQQIHGKHPLIYFDNGASTQRPTAVIEAMTALYENSYANVHRGLHFLSEKSSELYEQTRSQIQHLIGATHEEEVIFTSGTTLSINTVAHSWGNHQLQAGDEILLTIMEHHSNIIPWQQLAQRTGARIQFIDVTPNGQLDFDDLESKLSSKTKVVSFTAISNVLGTINPVKDIVQRAHAVGAKVMVDAAQHVPHESTKVSDWDADFVCFSGHKMLGPSGIGILYGKRELLEKMPPFLGGGSMISGVTTEGFTAGELPAKFEAGTPPIAEAIGLGAAIEYIEQIGIQQIAEHEKQLTSLAYQQLSQIDGLKILGPGCENRSGILSFVVEGLSPQDLSIFLDRKGVAIRAGHHCAMPLHDRLDISASCRASFYLYNTVEEVNRFVEILQQVINKLRG